MNAACPSATTDRRSGSNKPVGPSPVCNRLSELVHPRARSWLCLALSKAFDQRVLKTGDAATLLLDQRDAPVMHATAYPRMGKPCKSQGFPLAGHKPDSVSDDHLSLRRTRSLGGPRQRDLLRLAPDGVWLAGCVATAAGGLLPHRFTLTGLIVHKSAGGLLSVPLSVGFRRLDCPEGLSSVLPCGVRTFLEPSLSERQRDPRSPGLHDRW